MSRATSAAPPDPDGCPVPAAAGHQAAASVVVPALVLVGLPGVGKSTVGREAARRLGWPFLDFDEEIERREGRTVAELFAERGEAAFRRCERRLTEELAGRERIVLAPGGGWAAQPGLMDLLRPPARIIHRSAGPATAAARLGAGRASRPLLGGEDPAARLAALLRDRGAAYARADAVIDTEVIDFDAVVSRVCALASAPGPD